MVLAVMAVIGGGGACAEHVPIEGARCSLEHPCPQGFTCAGGGCVRLLGAPPARCERDEDCVIGACLEEAGFCVQCADDGDCAIGACLTADKRYQCGCDWPSQCATGRCNAAAHACVPCFSDRQCAADQRCELDTGMCRDRKIDDDDAGGEGTGGAASAQDASDGGA